MGGPAFFQTRMGVRFYEGTMPKVAEQLERLNDNLEALIDLLQNHGGEAPPPCAGSTRTPPGNKVS